VEEDPGRFEASVRRIHEYLRAGDVFQVNISRPWTGRFGSPPDPYRLYQSLRRANPAPFAGLMRWGERFLLSSSPERLVQTRGGTVQTRPIAGTRPRGADRAQDQALSEELIGNLKERAETKQLVDAENRDREALYAEIAKANGFPKDSIPKIKSIFARSWIDQARSGWWIQDGQGNWKRK
jgi:anthranilate synthase component 1